MTGGGGGALDQRRPGSSQAMGVTTFMAWQTTWAWSASIWWPQRPADSAFHNVCQAGEHRDSSAGARRRRRPSLATGADAASGGSYSRMSIRDGTRSGPRRVLGAAGTMEPSGAGIYRPSLVWQ